MILDRVEPSCLLPSVCTADRKDRFWPPSAVAVQPPITLESPVRTPQQEEYEEEMCPPSVGGAGGGACCYRCVGATTFRLLYCNICEVKYEGETRHPSTGGTDGGAYRWWGGMPKGAVVGALPKAPGRAGEPKFQPPMTTNASPWCKLLDRPGLLCKSAVKLITAERRHHLS